MSRLMKETSIEWLREIPQKWEVSRIKDCTFLKARIGWQNLRSDEFVDNTNWYCVTGQDFVDGKINWGNCYCVSEERYNQDKNIQLKVGDLLLTKDGTIGKTAFIDELPKKATLNSGVFVIRPIFDKFSNKYMFWVLNSKSFTYFIDFFKNGSTVLHLYQNVFERFTFPLPSLSEQHAIANFLDHKLAAMDAQVALLEKKRKTYLRLRKSLINQTVRKGLNPNAETKESGIEWLGKIPKHWEVKRVKEISFIKKGKLLESIDEQLPNYKPLLSLDYLRNDIPQYENFVYTEDKELHVSDGDIIVVWDGAGSGDILRGKKGILSSTIAKITLNERSVLTDFFYNLRFNLEYKLKSLPTGMGIPHINSNVLKEFEIPVPPLSEQRAIAEYLDTQSAKIDAIVENIGKQLIKLEQLKKSLINECVTGEREV